MIIFRNSNELVNMVNICNKKWTEGWRDETAKRDESKRNSQRLGPLLLLRVPEPAIIALSIIIIGAYARSYHYEAPLS